MSGRTTTRRRSLSRGTPVTYYIQQRHSQFWTWLWDATDRAVEAWLTRPRIGDTRPSLTPAVVKPRDHFRADGTPKKPRTLADAQRFVQENAGFRFYECSVCGEHHVGHKVRTRTIAA